jgi:hypothetical protein
MKTTRCPVRRIMRRHLAITGRAPPPGLVTAGVTRYLQQFVGTKKERPISRSCGKF